jgi:hypothetical protein
MLLIARTLQGRLLKAAAQMLNKAIDRGSRCPETRERPRLPQHSRFELSRLQRDLRSVHPMHRSNRIPGAFGSAHSHSRLCKRAVAKFHPSEENGEAQVAEMLDLDRRLSLHSSIVQ